ncbi:MAG: Sec-independent protein translocase protein TatB [Allosphingosinicella sp.]
MFGIDSAEILIIAVVALVVIGPKDLPRVMRTIGHFVGRARGMAKHFRSGFDTMMREAELEEMEKKWRSDNDRIMREHPIGAPPAAGSTSDGSDWGASPSVVDPSSSDSRPKPKAPPRPSAADGAAPQNPAPTAPPAVAPPRPADLP